MSIKQDIFWRILISFIFMTILGFAIIGKSLHIQYVEGEYWKNMNDSLTTSYHSISAERGNIYAEDGNLLATSIPFYEIRMDVNSTALDDATFNRNVDSLSLSLSAHFTNKSYEEYRKMLVSARKEKQRYLLIARKVTFPELQKIKRFPLFRLGKYKGGFIAIPKNRRIRPFNPSADRTIGYVRKGVTPVGLEGAYNSFLSGIEGKRLMQRIGNNVWIPIHDENMVEPENGKDIITTLDTYIQDVTEDALFKAITKHKADHGCAVVMEVATGKIKAIANLGKTPSGNYWEIYNYAVGESTEPGSTIKLVSMIAALEDNFITPEDSVYIQNGIIKYYDKDMKDDHGHFTGYLTVKRAFEISSNVAISSIINESYKSNPQAFVDHFNIMDLDKKTGINIAGEPAPFIKTPQTKSWSGTTLPWMSVGYELTLTPLQLLTFYNAIANDGEMMAPYLINEIQEFGRTYRKFEPQVINKKICSQPTIEAVQAMLEGVVERGTAIKIRSDLYPIAGKTGTTKIVEKFRGYIKVYQASFAGYFPADNPQYSCIVVISAPSEGGYYGSIVAAPVFKEIADKIYANRIGFMLEPKMIQARINTNNESPLPSYPTMKPGYKKDIATIYDKLGISFTADDDIKWAVVQLQETEIILKEQVVDEFTIPNVIGMGLQDAIFILENQGLNVRIMGKGKIIHQSISPGSAAVAGSDIILKLS